MSKLRLLSICLAVAAAGPAMATDGPPACDNARAQDLVKEAFIRRALVQGDHELIVRGTLAPVDAFAEVEIVEAMPRMLAMARLDGITERGYDPLHERRRCTARLVVKGWDLAPTATYEVMTVQDAAQFGVESSVQLLPGAQGLNMLLGYRSTFGAAIQQ